MFQLMVPIALLLLPLPINAQEDIGKVYEQTGSAVVERDKQNINLQQESAIQFLDNVKTGNGSVGITFIDDTLVAVSSQSSLVIDDFVYDPNSTGSSLGLQVAIGTVRYTSGNIARLNHQSVNIRTPTARIGVRGTAFSMTVNEVGKSLIILLPNIDGSVGEIEVITAAGTQVLTRAYEAVVTTYIEASPSEPVILDLTLDQINNLLIISPPDEIKILENEDENVNSIDNILDVDFLEYVELDENELEKNDLQFTLLDINELDVELLGNVLDQMVEVLSAAEMLDGRTPGLNERTQVFTIFPSEGELQLLRKVNNNDIVLNLNKDNGYTINLTQQGIQIPEITTADENLNGKITIMQNQ